jgi:hypothetical protein
MKIIITESQVKLLNEILGVPDNINKVAEELFKIISKDIQSINEKDEEYEFDGRVSFIIGGNKKIIINKYELIVNVKEFDEYVGKPDIIQMGMGQSFMFDRDEMMKKIRPSTTAEMTITFAVSPESEPYELYETLMNKKDEYVSSIAHEIKHKYDKQVKQLDLISRDVKYVSTQKIGNFGIPVIDGKFFRYMYFIEAAENLVRPTEISSEMESGNITKSQFREFLENNKVYKELMDIKNFTFNKFINELNQSEDRMDALLDHIGEDPSSMTKQEKIKRVLEIVFINLTNIRANTFDDMVLNKEDELRKMFSSVFSENLPSFLNDDGGSKKVDDLRSKFLTRLMRFQNDPIKFFEYECEKFNYVASKMIKKIGKLYGLAKDDQPMNESILNWELYQQLMEKKYGKRKIETEFKFKK